MFRSKRWLINSGLSLLSIIISVVAVEGVLRLTQYKGLIVVQGGAPKNYYQYDSTTGYDIKENFPETYTYIKSEIFRYKIWSNELGCFDKPYSGEKEYALLLGDSFTHSYAPFESKWGSHLEDLLDYSVLKCGVSGYGTKQELVKAERLISKIATPPKLIIVGYFVNDLIEDYLYPYKLAVGGYLVKTKEIVNPGTGEISIVNNDLKDMVRKWEKLGVAYEHPHPIVKSIEWWLKRNSVLYNMGDSTIRSLFKVASVKNLMIKSGIVMLPREEYAFFSTRNYPWLENAWEDHLKNLAAFKKLADDNGSRLLFIIIPTKEQVYSFLEDDQKFDDEQPNKIVGNYLQKEGISYLDLLPLFRKYANLEPRKYLNSDQDLYWKHDGHWSLKGNYLASLLVSIYMLENNLVDVIDKDERVRTIKERLEKFN